MAAAAEPIKAPIVDFSCLDFKDIPWSEKEVTSAKVKSLTVQIFKTLVLDYEARLQALKGGDTSVLLKGFWYANQHMLALKTSGAYPELLERLRGDGSYYHGLAPKGFTLVDQPIKSPSQLTGIAIQRYVLKEGVEPDQALKQMLPIANEDLYFSECGSLIDLAHYVAIRHILGRDRFNRLFDARSDGPMEFFSLGVRALVPFQDIKEDTGQLLKMGMSTHFKNVPLYHFRHRDGDGGGWHVMCISKKGEERFIGFGLPYKEQGSSEQEVHQHLRDAFKEMPIALTDLVPKEVAIRRKPIPLMESAGLSRLPKDQAKEFLAQMLRTKEIVKEDFDDAVRQGAAGRTSFVKTLSAAKILAELKRR